MAWEIDEIRDSYDSVHHIGGSRFSLRNGAEEIVLGFFSEREAWEARSHILAVVTTAKEIKVQKDISTDISGVI